MSIFAKETQSDPLPIPWDPPHWVQVRKLTGREIERAQEAHRDGLAMGRARVWGAFLKRALEHGASDPDVLKAIHDPLTGYDRYELVKGLVASSYAQLNAPPEPVKGAGPDLLAAATRQKAIDGLDDEAVEFIATEVLRLTKPHLFQTAADAEAEKKTADDPASVARAEGAATV